MPHIRSAHAADLESIRRIYGELERRARDGDFHKVVLFMLPFNANACALYRKFGYREVGVFEEQGRLDGKFVDVMEMEKILERSRADRSRSARVHGVAGWRACSGSEVDEPNIRSPASPRPGMM